MEFFDDSANSKSKPKAQSTTEDIDTQVELVTKFFNFHTSEREDNDFYTAMIVDLYRAITCYRMYDSIDEFMAINPELNDCRDDIVALWKEFDRLSSEDLSEVALELLKDI